MSYFLFLYTCSILIVYCKFRMIPCRGSAFCLFSLKNVDFCSKKKTVLIQIPNSIYSAAAAAKSRESCRTLYDPIDGSPPGSPDPGILQARTLEWVAISFSSEWKWKVKVKSVVSNSWRPHGLQPTRLLRPWDFLGKRTGVGCHCLLRINF